ncbi:MAG: efflux RND transporter periplasmic adaptor subunit [Pirellulaceae bacterium]|nr:efflux RND transporter periplasmic adaptor subunit [Pirellulaceae bacterium]
MDKPKVKIRIVFIGVIIATALIIAYAKRDSIQAVFNGQTTSADNTENDEQKPQDNTTNTVQILELSPQARKNLSLVSKLAEPQDYWKTIEVPGVIIDRPGFSDHGISSPAVGVVTQVHAYAGDTVKSGDKLFTLKLFSEYLHDTQANLFQATRETILLNEERQRLDHLAQSGTIATARIIEFDQHIRRQQALIESYKQDLQTRGLSVDQIQEVAAGKFISTITVTVPTTATAEPSFEVQELHVNLGYQVNSGQLLSIISDHRSLYIEGHAFKQEAPSLEQAAKNGWSLEVEFAEDDSEHWPALEQAYQIRHLSSTIDSSSRTFDFFVPLVNQSRSYEHAGRSFMVWRFRPGQRVRVRVPVEQFHDVIVLPAAAVVREGPEAYVFRQNGDLFQRLPVHVIHEDRLFVVLANDDSVQAGAYIAQGSAASLNRVLKAQSASGQQADVHVHADGSVHAAH